MHMAVLGVAFGALLAGVVSASEVPHDGPSLNAADRDRLGTLAEDFGIRAGSNAPDVTASAAGGTPFSLREAWTRAPVMLVFYRGGWCPYCNLQIRQLVETYPEFVSRGVELVAISVDQVSESARTTQRYKIPFPVLSDPDLVVHSAFNVGFEVDDELVARYREMGLDLEGSSGREHHTIAVPSVFIIDRDGTIRFAHADPDYKTRPTVKQLLGVIDELDLNASE